MKNMSLMSLSESCGKKTVTVNGFAILLTISSLCAMGAVRYGSAGLRWGSYISEILLIIFAFMKSVQNKGFLLSRSVILCLVVLVANYIISPFNHNNMDLLKYFGYLCVFNYGYSLSQKYDFVKVNSIILYLFILLPVIVVGMFDDTIEKNAFFTTPNTFVFFGLSVGLFYAFIKNRSGKSFWIAWIITTLYILTCSSLGVVVAIGLSYFVLNFKKEYIPKLMIGAVILLAAIFLVDLPVFIRFRDVISLWKTMSADDWKNLQDANFYELNHRVDVAGDRTDVGSSIWRLMQWTGLLSDYLSSVWPIPFGFGTGYSVHKTGLLPHNDYVMILTEYGLVVFMCFIRFVRKVFLRLKDERFLIYFILSMIIYYLTENLIVNFPQNAILYFVIGWCMCKYNPVINRRYENIVD